MYVVIMTIISQFSIPVVPIHEKSTFINLGTPWLLEKVRALGMPTIQGDGASGKEGQSSRGKTLRKKINLAGQAETKQSGAAENLQASSSSVMDRPL